MRRFLPSKIIIPLFVLIVSQVRAQEVQDSLAYANAVAEDSAMALIPLDKISDVYLDIRYATANNFTGAPVYPYAAAYARRPVAEALARVAERARRLGLGLWIWDGYRPYRSTVLFWERVGDPNYVADPKYGSRHNRGCAVDLCLYELKTGKPLPLPTPYDEFTERAHPDFPLPEGPEKKHRELLISLMKEEGFTVFPTEWWHFDFAGWDNFPLLDVPFRALD